MTAALSGAAVSFAQVDGAQFITPTFTATPRDAGTKAKPKNASVFTKGVIDDDVNATLSRMEYTVPRTIKLDGTGFKRCPPEQVDLRGESSCPPGSQIGTGSATARLSGPNPQNLNFTIKVYANGPKALTISLVGIVSDAFPATIKGRVVGFDIPPNVQQPIPGLYTYVTSIESRLGKQKGISGAARVKGKKRYFASVIGCTNGRHAGKVKGFLAPNPDPPIVPSAEVRASSPCQK